MENDDIVTFGQNDLPCTSFAVLQEMKKTGELCDVTIKAQNLSLVAHRAILASAIPYFRSIFAGNQWETKKREIGLEDLNPEALESIVDFAYGSKISISTKNVNLLLMASHRLQLQQVQDACVQYLSDRLRLDNAAQVRAIAHSINNSKLADCSSRFIRQNFIEVSKTNDFLNLPYSCVKEIISRADLNVPTEEEVFEAIISWVEVSPRERHFELPDLLREVRMIYLSKDYLIKRIATEELVRNSKPCMDLIDEVKNFHLLPKHKSVFSNLNVLPRKRGNSIAVSDMLFAVCQSTDLGTSLYCCDFSNERWYGLTYEEHSETVYRVVATTNALYMFLEETIHALHLKTLEWEILESRHEWIFGAAILSKGNMVYCFGSNHEDLIDKIRCFSTEQKKWLKEGRILKGRYSSAAALLGKFIYITGGFDGKKYLNVVERYDPSTDKSCETAPMIMPRSSHGSSCTNEAILVCGGDTACGRTTPSAEMYNPLTDQWYSVSPLKNARRNFSLVTYNDKIYALAGTRVTAGSIFMIRDFEEYDPESDTWKSCFPVPENFRHALSIPSVMNSDGITRIA